MYERTVTFPGISVQWSSICNVDVFLCCCGVNIISQVEDLVKTLLDCYNKRPEAEEESEETGVAMKEDMDARWQLFLQKFLSMQDQGNNFINSSTMVSSMKYVYISLLEDVCH